MDITRAAALLGMLAHEKRFAILVKLAEAKGGRLPVDELAAATGMTTRAVRNHMKRIADFDLAVIKKYGGRPYCIANKSELRAFTNAIVAALGSHGGGQDITNGDEQSKRKTESAARHSEEPRQVSYRSLRDKLSVVDLVTETN